MRCPNCKDGIMQEEYWGRDNERHSFTCEDCGFSMNAFDAHANNEGYPADQRDFEDWARERGINDYR